MTYEWDVEKASRNLRRHRISFEVAQNVFSDPLRLSGVDSRNDYGEERWWVLGHARGALVFVIYTERAASTRIISARKATRHERRRYEARDADASV